MKTFKVTLRPPAGEPQTYIAKGPDGQPREREVVRYVVLQAKSKEEAQKVAEANADELSVWSDAPPFVVESVETE